MTWYRVAAIAALSLIALPVTAVGGEAPGDTFNGSIVGCDETHPRNQDFVDLTSKVSHQTGPMAAASRLVPVRGAKVITKLIDLTPQNGNNVVKARDSDKTNRKGKAETRHQFNNFGNYRVKMKVKVGGEVVARDKLTFGVSDRVDGKCGPPLGGPP